MRPEGCVAACPGCPHRDLSREESERAKNDWLAAELSPWGAVLFPLLSPAERWGYRRKALLHARHFAEAWRFGMVKREGREEIFVDIPDCPLHEPRINELSRALGNLPAEWPLAYALHSGHALTLVLKSRRRQDWLDRLRELAVTWPGGSLFVNWHPTAGKRVVDSRHNELVFGEEWLRDGAYFHGPTAFRQQIPEMAGAAFSRAAAFLGGGGVVVDLYSGLGASLAHWREAGAETVGVELAGESIAVAARNAPGAVLLRGRVEDRLPQVEEFLAGRQFVVYTNPPRSGHHARALGWLLEKKPARLAYLSCHPRSLAGDLRKLGEAFRVAELRPYDFFPQTRQVEVLALLERGAVT